MKRIALLLGLFLALAAPVAAQVPPTPTEIESYSGLFAAAQAGDVAEVQRLAQEGANLDGRDGRDRTALHIAAHAGKAEVVALLGTLGADMNALEFMAYDAVTIAAVANDLPVLRTALEGGNRADLITSPYDGTALIAAAHLGHWQVVDLLIEAGAPLDHVNNLGWTALIEAVVLGDGGENHQKTVAALLAGGADRTITDFVGATPLEMAIARDYTEIADLLRAQEN